MKILYKYRLDLERGKITFDAVVDVTVVNKEKIVRKKDREYDLKQGFYTYVKDLNKYTSVSFKGEIIAIEYVSFKPDVILEIMKHMATNIYNEKINGLKGQIDYFNNQIDKIRDLSI